MNQAEVDKKYEKQPDGHYKCRKCGGEIMGKTVTQPVWDGLFPCSGSGQVVSSQVPYCPKCDTEPNASGLPGYEKDL